MARRRRFTLTDYQESGLLASSACDLLEVLMVRHPDIKALAGAHALALGSKQQITQEQARKAVKDEPEVQARNEVHVYDEPEATPV